MDHFRHRYMTSNPWRLLPAEPPYVLPDDAEVLRRYLRRSDPQIRLEVLPCPFIGSPEQATVYLLSLNPAFTDRVVDYRNPAYDGQLRNALTFESAYPFWPLEPALQDTPGAQYWAPRLRKLLEHCDPKLVAQRLMCLQFFPYHSRSGRDVDTIREILPSQEFTFQLARRAVATGRLIVLLRSETRWLSRVPELAQAPLIKTKNPLAQFLSKNNLGAGNLARVVSAIRGDDGGSLVP